ncbi:unnamed protein product [Ixodes pacificus]
MQQPRGAENKQTEKKRRRGQKKQKWRTPEKEDKRVEKINKNERKNRAEERCSRTTHKRREEAESERRSEGERQGRRTSLWNKANGTERRRKKTQLPSPPLSLGVDDDAALAARRIVRICSDSRAFPLHWTSLP